MSVQPALDTDNNEDAMTAEAMGVAVAVKDGKRRIVFVSTKGKKHTLDGAQTTYRQDIAYYEITDRTVIKEIGIPEELTLEQLDNIVCSGKVSYSAGIYLSPHKVTPDAAPFVPPQS